MLYFVADVAAAVVVVVVVVVVTTVVTCSCFYRASIVGKEVLPPPELERIFGLTGGRDFCIEQHFPSPKLGVLTHIMFLQFYCCPNNCRLLFVFISFPWPQGLVIYRAVLQYSFRLYALFSCCKDFSLPSKHNHCICSMRTNFMVRSH